MRKVKISIVVVLAVFSLLFSTAGAVTADDLANTLNSGWSSSGGSTYGSWYSVALYWLRTLGSDTSSIKLDVSSIKTELSSSMTLLKNDISSIRAQLSGFSGIFNSWSTVFGALKSNTDTIKSDITESKGHLSDIVDSIQALEQFFVNAHHTALENATNDATDQATSFVQNNAGGTTQAQKNAAISGFSTSAAGVLDTGVSSDSAWGFLSTGDAAYQPGLLPSGRSGNIFAFFSTETMYDLDPSLATRAPQPEVVDYLSLNQQTFDALKGEGSDQR